MATSVDISGFNRGMAAFVDKLGIEPPKVLKKEMGELVKTLMRITPAAEGEKIRDQITFKFALLGGSLGEMETKALDIGKMGKQGINWFFFSSSNLLGVASENDKRDASVDEIKQLSYKITKRGAVRGSIKNHPGQTAIVYQTILTKASTVNKLVAQKTKNRGRLKAGWCAAWDFLSPSGSLPGYVSRHLTGLRGYFINGLGIKGFPTFTIANTASGVSDPKVNLDWLVRSALSIRAKAMQKNLLMFMSGKKHLSDYA